MTSADIAHVAFNTARSWQLALGNLRCAVRLRPQAWIECPSGARYRLDFAVEPLDDLLHAGLLHAGCALTLGVELDGHEYHERTREQVTARNRRDRDLAALGWTVLHFSGSEVHQNAMAVAAEALGAAADALDAAKGVLAHALH